MFPVAVCSSIGRTVAMRVLGMVDLPLLVILAQHKVRAESGYQFTGAHAQDMAAARGGAIPLANTLRQAR